MGVGCHFLLQSIFPTRGLNPCLLHWQVDSLSLSHQENRSLCGGGLVAKLCPTPGPLKMKSLSRGERSRDWSLGHTGDEGPQLAMMGESQDSSRTAATVCGFSLGTTARSVSLSWGAREVGSPCEWRGGGK